MKITIYGWSTKGLQIIKVLLSVLIFVGVVRASQTRLVHNSR
ncbi:hypothetical protein [Streptomyces sp. NPDC005507]